MRNLSIEARVAMRPRFIVSRPCALIEFYVDEKRISTATQIFDAFRTLVNVNRNEAMALDHVFPRYA